MRSRILVSMFILAMAAFMVHGATVAWFTGVAETTQNEFATGTLTVVTGDENLVYEPNLDLKYLVPGDVITGSFKVKNEGTVDFWYDVAAVTTGDFWASVTFNVDTEKGFLAADEELTVNYSIEVNRGAAMGKEGTLKFTVNATQARNFTPDWVAIVNSDAELNSALADSNIAVIVLEGNFNAFQISRGVTIMGGSVEVGHGPGDAQPFGIYVNTNNKVVLDGVEIWGAGSDRGILIPGNRNPHLVVMNSIIRDVRQGMFFNSGKATVIGTEFINTYRGIILELGDKVTIGTIQGNDFTNVGAGNRGISYGTNYVPAGYANQLEYIQWLLVNNDFAPGTDGVSGYGITAVNAGDNLQQAIDNASDGAVLFVSGTHPGDIHVKNINNLVMVGKDATIQGKLTLGTSGTTCVYDITIDGFAIENGQIYSYAGGLVRIINNTIDGSGNYNHGIINNTAHSYSRRFIIENNIIKNFATGIDMGSIGPSLFANNTITNVTRGIVIGTTHNAHTVTLNTIETSLHGISIGNSPGTDVTNNTLKNVAEVTPPDSTGIRSSFNLGRVEGNTFEGFASNTNF